MPSQKVRDLTDTRNGSDEVRTHNHYHEDGTCCCGEHHHEHGAECGHEHSHEPEHKHGHDEACGCGEAHTHEEHEHDACCGKEPTNISMAKAVGVGNITMNTKKAAAAENIITATTFRGTRRTVTVKSAIRTKNTATCAAKALKTAPAVCRTLTA